MKKLFFSLIATLLIGISSYASTPRPDEGMWLPMFVERLNWVDIQEMGLNLSAEEMYSINNSSLKDAVVGLASGSAPNGYFCTGEIVSDQGLVFTNHHCGYDVIQNHSTIEHDYLTDGFWAMSYKEELNNPGLTASILVRMDDLTDEIVSELTGEMTADERRAKIREITKPIKEEASEDGKYDVVVKSFYGGNEYYMFVYQTYKDVRLVGAPPESIGKFGGDTDNWMWPRHTGDFSVFRIYTAPDGTPAEYSEENIPLKPKHHLPISLKGYQKDDYAMIWGFPGGTERYLTSYGIEFALEKKNPALINVLGQVLEVMKSYMDSDPVLRIEYASDYAGLANGWKYFIGQTKGLKDLDVKGKKEAIEKDFTTWVNANADRKEKYGNVLEDIKSGYGMMDDNVTPLYYLMIGSSNIDLLSSAMGGMQLNEMLADKKENEVAIDETTASMKARAEGFFETFNYDMDSDLTKALLRIFLKNLPSDQLPDVFVTIDNKFKGDIDKYVDNMYEKSIFSNEGRLMKFLDKPSQKKLEKDPAFAAMQSFMAESMAIQGAYGQGQAMVDDNMQLFIAGLREMNPQKNYYPDANSTLRFSYGSVKDYYPADAVHYDYTTNLYGVMEKEDPTNPEFVVPERLKELYLKKDFGPYAENGKLITCFLSTNDITGGNSGSPVMNGNGELIGIAFDGNWEAMSGDIAFEEELQRTINVDIRYVLWVIDKFAGAQNLIDELTIVK
jgi:hypothetical protein